MHHLMRISTATAVPLQVTQCKQDCLESQKTCRCNCKELAGKPTLMAVAGVSNLEKSTLTYRSGSCAYNELKGCVVS